MAKSSANFLGEVGCGGDATWRLTKGVAERANWDGRRLYARQLAQRLLGDDCLNAVGLPEKLRNDLRRIAAQP
jgi:hypothetical protein